MSIKSVPFNDKYTSQPFKEPEGMTTIDLNNYYHSSQDIIEKENKTRIIDIKIRVLKIIFVVVGLVLVGLLTFILVIILTHQESRLIPEKHVKNTTFRNNSLDNYHKLNEHITTNKKQFDICKKTKNLEDCCNIFTTQTKTLDLIEICTVSLVLNLLLKYELENNERDKRQIIGQALYEGGTYPISHLANENNNEAGINSPHYVFSFYDYPERSPDNNYYPQGSEIQNENYNQFVVTQQPELGDYYNSYVQTPEDDGLKFSNTNQNQEELVGIELTESPLPSNMEAQRLLKEFISTSQPIDLNNDELNPNFFLEITTNPQSEPVGSLILATEENAYTSLDQRLVLPATSSPELSAVDALSPSIARNPSLTTALDKYLFSEVTTNSQPVGSLLLATGDNVYVSLEQTTILPFKTSASVAIYSSAAKNSNSKPDVDKNTSDSDTNSSDLNKTRQNEFDFKQKVIEPFPTANLDVQTSQSKQINPCFYPNPFNSQNRAFQGLDESQFLTVIPMNKVPYVLNPNMYSYVSQNYPFYGFPLIQQPSFNPYFSTANANLKSPPVQVTGTNGQYYLCNPIPSPSNNIAGLPGVEVRHNLKSSNLQELFLDNPHPHDGVTNKTRNAIICPFDEQSCLDGSKCIRVNHICDNEVHCDDGSDEMDCSCKSRIGTMRVCDGYLDCPNGEDEWGCFDCSENEFSCDDWSHFRQGTCVSLDQRCDGIRQCEITGKDEEDCTILTDQVGEQIFYQISNAVGFLHRNFKGKWYPSCLGTDVWMEDVCQTEAGPSTILPKSHMVPTPNAYNGPYINLSPNSEFKISDTCLKNHAVFVTCPPLFCGLRMTIKNPYRATEVETSAEDMLNNLKYSIRNSNNRKKINLGSDVVGSGSSRVVGGKPSQPAAWPWVVSIYKNGVFHCGGVLINDLWILTAAHCVDKYWLHFYEMQAGMLRRFSYCPMEQNRRITVALPHELYDKSTLKNDIALMKLSSPLRFNRYVRPICLPSEATAGRTYMRGPSPGTICTTVGWGATVEHGIDPDHLREVEVPISGHCKHAEDEQGDEICAGLFEGGKDACQGDSGGPLMCRNPNNPNQWYLAGIVSHGEGCARPNEPGVYTKVCNYIGWIAESTRENKFFPRLPLHKCPGYTCKVTNKCLPKKRHCDKIVDCLFGDDEIDCEQEFNNIFKHFRNNKIVGVSLDTQTTADNFLNSQNSALEVLIENRRFGKKITKTGLGKERGKLFLCKTMLQIVPANKECDKIIDCEDGTDETRCSCADYIQNTHPKLICDGVTDCKDLSDEFNCSNCSSTQYYCRLSKKCIELVNRCDGIPQCNEREDEWDCVALTNGTTLLLDSNLRPKQSMNGIITINRFGVWRALCANISDNAASIATNVCNLLGFEEYVAYHIFSMKDVKPVNVTRDSLKQNDYLVDKPENMWCSNIFIQCSNISSGNNIRMKMYRRELELYSYSPWNAMVFVDGEFKCMSTLFNTQWIVTSIGCFQGLVLLPKFYYIVALLGKGKGSLENEGPHEQIVPIIETIRIGKSDVLLLRLLHQVDHSRYVQPAYLSKKIYNLKNEKCVTTNLKNNRTHLVSLKPIPNCKNGFRCFLSVDNQELCQNSSEISSGVINCDSRNGFYPAAVFDCSKNPKKFTSIKFMEHEIQDTINNRSGNGTKKELATMCDGFRCYLGNCINKNNVCNGIADCTGGEDEDQERCNGFPMNCHLSGSCICKFSELKCNNGKCIPKKAFCDGINDCDDYSDEPAICSCRAYLELTHPEKNCDGIVHCYDRSDEDPRICHCTLEDYSCGQAGYCVSKNAVCDGFTDCPNGEDERFCLSLKTNGDWSNSGEVIKRTAGIWHSGCFAQRLTTSELEEVCQKVGFTGGSAKRLPPHNITTLRPVIDHFNVVWIHRTIGKAKLKIRLRTGNSPYITFIKDSDCYKLFIESGLKRNSGTHPMLPNFECVQEVPSS